MNVSRLTLVLSYASQEDLKLALDEVYQEILSQSQVEGVQPNMMGDICSSRCQVDFQVDTVEAIRPISLSEVFEEWVMEES